MLVQLISFEAEAMFLNMLLKSVVLTTFQCGAVVSSREPVMGTRLVSFTQPLRRLAMLIWRTEASLPGFQSRRPSMLVSEVMPMNAPSRFVTLAGRQSYRWSTFSMLVQPLNRLLMSATLVTFQLRNSVRSSPMRAALL